MHSELFCFIQLQTSKVKGSFYHYVNGFLDHLHLVVIGYRVLVLTLHEERDCQEHHGDNSHDTGMRSSECSTRA
jgi:hypothetical protein